MDIFRTLGSGSLSVTAMLDFSGKANTSIHGLGQDDTAKWTHADDGGIKDSIIGCWSNVFEYSTFGADIGKLIYLVPDN